MTKGGVTACCSALVVAALMVFTPVADAAPRNQLCNVASWRDLHPAICADDGPLGPMIPGGGGPQDGLIGRILQGLGLGGLL